MRLAVWEGEVHGDSGPEARQATRPEPGAGPGAGAGLRDEVAEAANVLARLGLVTAYGHVSARAGESMLITPAADLACVTGSGVIEVPLAAPRRRDAARGRSGGGVGAPRPVPRPARRGRDRPGPAGQRVRRGGHGLLAGPAARPGRVARRIGAGARRRRAAQVTRAGRTGGRAACPPARRCCCAATAPSPWAPHRASRWPGCGCSRPPATSTWRPWRPPGPTRSPRCPARRSPHGAPSAANCSPGSGSTCGAAPGAGFAGPDPGEVQG